ncbi:hypothetical protein ACFO5R_02695 [Halosolutus amylolyticus]|uniref:Uncharacterized protein n=1 Tax=Halosolutus amylolyticus TaxID=2932267 RepID=A0ABD5PK51_9EURY|nr:hypothetical protein [Halosolutus amylolyticus]
MEKYTEISPAIMMTLHEQLDSDQQTVAHVGPDPASWGSGMRRPRVIHIPIVSINAGDAVLVGRIFEEGASLEAYDCEISERPVKTTGCEMAAELIEKELTGISYDEGPIPVEFEGDKEVMEEIVNELDTSDEDIDVMYRSASS